MHYFAGISTADLARELLTSRTCVARGEEKPAISDAQKFSPVFVEIEGQRIQIFGINYDQKQGITVLTAYKNGSNSP